MDLYNNKSNDRLKFKINSEGINVSDIEPRLIFNSTDKINYVIYGEIKEGICYFNIPELKLYENNSTGNVKFELVSKDLYFKLWEDNFKIKTISTIKFEEMVRETNIDDKPKIKATIFESKPIFESEIPNDEHINNIQDDDMDDDMDSNNLDGIDDNNDDETEYNSDLNLMSFEMFINK